MIRRVLEDRAQRLADQQGDTYLGPVRLVSEPDQSDGKRGKHSNRPAVGNSILGRGVRLDRSANEWLKDQEAEADSEISGEMAEAASLSTVR